ncbi:MAG: hypothetical protein EXS46_02750 [Candidatus Taylorbacteria bacterium]|nr:hypothetical protein [Candidatus Taylorbacteria bacterium]
MKFVLYFSNLISNPGSSTVLSNNPLPHPSVLENVADLLVPAIHRNFDSIDAVLAEPSVNCFAIAGLLLRLLQTPVFHSTISLGAHLGDTPIAVRERSMCTIIEASKLTEHSAILLTSNPAMFAAVNCIAKGQCGLETIEDEILAMRGQTQGWDFFKLNGTHITLL